MKKRSAGIQRNNCYGVINAGLRSRDRTTVPVGCSLPVGEVRARTRVRW